ncbi:hypothetical protein MBLNU457_g2750t1 [Dothideomycetes sp. NU457]
MRLNSLLLGCSAASTSIVSATNIFVASYAGNVTTFSLEKSGSDYSLIKKFANGGCAPNPSWLTIDYEKNHLFCVEESLEADIGHMTEFTINSDGSLELRPGRRVETLVGPVYSVLYGSRYHSQSIALAHYSGSGISAWDVSNRLPAPEFITEKTWSVDQASHVNPERQDAPHAHQVAVPPGGKSLFVPDLGSDKVRIFTIGNDRSARGNNSNALVESAYPLITPPGCGPRHVAFYRPFRGVADTFLFLNSELANTISSYNMTLVPATRHEPSHYEFQEVYSSTYFGANKSVPVNSTIAEIALSPDSRFVVVSTRGDRSFNITNPDPKNSTYFPSDSLITYKIHVNGTLDLVQVAPAGGLQPRHFSMNSRGDLIAVGLQAGEAIVVFERNADTGMVGKEVARYSGLGEVTNVRWDEEVFDGTNWGTGWSSSCE